MRKAKRLFSKRISKDKLLEEINEMRKIFGDNIIDKSLKISRATGIPYQDVAITLRFSRN